jgi:PRC-barrel domain
LEVEYESNPKFIIAAVAVAIVHTEGSFAQETGSFPSLLAASEIKGTKVKNLQNENIGDIHELLIEPTAGWVRFVILSVGGSLGIGDTKVAVPWKAFKITKEAGTPKYVLDATKERTYAGPSCRR